MEFFPARSHLPQNMLRVPRLAILATLVFCCWRAALAAEDAPATLHRLSDVRRLSTEQAARGLPVSFSGTVLSSDYVAEGRSLSLFLHDGEAGVYVSGARTRTDLRPGQRVQVAARTARGGFAPCITDARIEVLDGSPHFPPPRVSKAAELASAAGDAQWVEVRGLVRGVGMDGWRVELQMMADGVRLTAKLATPRMTKAEAARFIGAEVAVRGVCYSKFTKRRQLFGVGLMVPGPEFVEVLHPSPADPFAVPARSVDELLKFRADDWYMGRVKVTGAVTFSKPGEPLFIRDAERSLMVQTRQRDALAAGDVIEVAGFPAFQGYAAILEDAVCRRLHSGPPMAPRTVTVEQAFSGDCEAELVSIEARVIEVSTRGEEQELSLAAAGGAFRAVHAGRTRLPIAPQAVARFTGICVTDAELAFRPGDGWRPRSFRLLLRSPEDVAIIAQPPWWTFERIAFVAACLLAVLLGALSWVGALHRQVGKATARVKEQVEREALLEERNRLARDIHDTLAQGYVGTAFQLEALDAKLQDAPAAIRRHLEGAQAMVRHGIAEARRSVVALRGQGDGAVASLSGLRDYAEMLASQSRAQLHWECRGEPPALSTLAEVNLVRIAQEAIANAVHHGDPEHLWVTLSSQAGAVMLEVADDGRGFDTNAEAPYRQPGHFGLLGMRERAREMGARLQISARPGGGTRVAVHIPAAPAAAPRPD